MLTLLGLRSHVSRGHFFFFNLTGWSPKRDCSCGPFHFKLLGIADWLVSFAEDGRLKQGGGSPVKLFIQDVYTVFGKSVPSHQHCSASLSTSHRFQYEHRHFVHSKSAPIPIPSACYTSYHGGWCRLRQHIDSKTITTSTTEYKRHDDRHTR